VNWKEYVSPWLTVPELGPLEHGPDEQVTVWGAALLFVQVTVSPARTVMLAGTKQYWPTGQPVACIDTEPCAATVRAPSGASAEITAAPAASSSAAGRPGLTLIPSSIRWGRQPYCATPGCTRPGYKV